MNRQAAPHFAVSDSGPSTERAERPDVMVVSHERSGTHFLINALTRAYDYPADLLDFDQPSLNINFFAPQVVANVLAQVAGRHASSIIKSHHDVDFFDSILDSVLKRVIIFYIHRDPVEVMLSYWRFMHNWSWHEGPRVPTALAFAASEPEGQMMRYQMKQRRNMLDRWASHVDGWTRAAAGRPRLVVVRYDQLRDNYAATVSGFGGLLGRRSGSLVPPDRRVGTILGPPPKAFPAPDMEALRAFALDQVGDTMRRLGYA